MRSSALLNPHDPTPCLTMDLQHRWMTPQAPRRREKSLPDRPDTVSESRNWWFSQTYGRLQTAAVDHVITGFKTAGLFDVPGRRRRGLPGRRLLTAAGPCVGSEGQAQNGLEASESREEQDLTADSTRPRSRLGPVSNAQTSAGLFFLETFNNVYASAAAARCSSRNKTPFVQAQVGGRSWTSSDASRRSFAYPSHGRPSSAPGRLSNVSAKRCHSQHRNGGEEKVVPLHASASLLGIPHDRNTKRSMSGTESEASRPSAYESAASGSRRVLAQAFPANSSGREHISDWPRCKPSNGIDALTLPLLNTKLSEWGLSEDTTSTGGTAFNSARSIWTPADSSPSETARDPTNLLNWPCVPVSTMQAPPSPRKTPSRGTPPSLCATPDESAMTLASFPPPPPRRMPPPPPLTLHPAPPTRPAPPPPTQSSPSFDSMHLPRSTDLSPELNEPIPTGSPAHNSPSSTSRPLRYSSQAGSPTQPIQLYQSQNIKIDPSSLSADHHISSTRAKLLSINSQQQLRQSARGSPLLPRDDAHTFPSPFSTSATSSFQSESHSPHLPLPSQPERDSGVETDPLAELRAQLNVIADVANPKVPNYGLAEGDPSQEDDFADLGYLGAAIL